MKGTKRAVLNKPCWIDRSDVLFSILWNKGFTVPLTHFYPQCILLYHCSVFSLINQKLHTLSYYSWFCFVRLLGILWFKIITFDYNIIYHLYMIYFKLFSICPSILRLDMICDSQFELQFNNLNDNRNYE